MASGRTPQERLPSFSLRMRGKERANARGIVSRQGLSSRVPLMIDEGTPPIQFNRRISVAHFQMEIFWVVLC